MRVKSYEAVNEQPRVFVAYGSDPSKCLRNMATILDEQSIDFWVATRVDYRDHGPMNTRFSMIIYV